VAQKHQIEQLTTIIDYLAAQETEKDLDNGLVYTAAGSVDYLHYDIKDGTGRVGKSLNRLKCLSDGSLVRHSTVADPSTSASASVAVTAPGFGSMSTPIDLNVSIHNDTISPSAPASKPAESIPPAPPKPTTSSPGPTIASTSLVLLMAPVPTDPVLTGEREAPAPVVEAVAPVPTIEHDAPIPTVEPSAPVPTIERDAPTPIVESTVPVPVVEHDAPPLSPSPDSPSHVRNSILPDSSHVTDPAITGNIQSKSILGSAIADPTLPGQSSIQTLEDPDASHRKTTGKGSKKKPLQSKKLDKPIAMATRKSARGKRELDNAKDANANVDSGADAEPSDGKGRGPPTKRRRMGA
jgi:hypothetical protein